MGAKDTVMSKDEIELRLGYLANGLSEDVSEIRKVLEVQAEITGEIMFRAGQEEGRRETWDTAIKEAVQGTRREVVEWVDSHKFEYTDSEGFARLRYPFTDDEWQAKLKEWGLS